MLGPSPKWRPDSSLAAACTPADSTMLLPTWHASVTEAHGGEALLAGRGTPLVPSMALGDGSPHASPPSRASPPARGPPWSGPPRRPRDRLTVTCQKRHAGLRSSQAAQRSDNAGRPVSAAPAYTAPACVRVQSHAHVHQNRLHRAAIRVALPATPHSGRMWAGPWRHLTSSPGHHHRVPGRPGERPGSFPRALRTGFDQPSW